MPDYGRDVSTYPDLDVTGRHINGPRVIIENGLRRMTTPEGSLEYDREFGRDVRDWLNEDFTDAEIRREESRLAAEWEKDERVLRADVELTLEREANRIVMRVAVQPNEGDEFTGVLAISNVSVSVLRIL